MKKIRKTRFQLVIHPYLLKNVKLVSYMSGKKISTFVTDILDEWFRRNGYFK